MWEPADKTRIRERERGAGSKLSSVRKKIKIQQKKRVPWNRKFVQVPEQCHSDAAVSSPCAGRIRFALNWLALFLSRGGVTAKLSNFELCEEFWTNKKITEAPPPSMSDVGRTVRRLSVGSRCRIFDFDLHKRIQIARQFQRKRQKGR